ncbi:MAG: porin [Boseongicola sp.]|nr:porin [Boseongicola sp.]
MKRVLLASTALVMSAGIAAAEVAVGGDGRMGVQSTDGGDVKFSSRVRISFTASGETDNGLTFGGSIRADNASGGSGGTAGSVHVAGAFGKVAMGDVDSAAKAAVGHAGGVGYTGLGDWNEIKYIGGGNDPSALWNYTMGDLTMYASAGNPNYDDADDDEDVDLSGALSYSLGDVGFGVGVERRGDLQTVAAGVNATLGDASVKLVYGSYDDGDASTDNVDSYGASASFVSGSATFSAFASGNSKGMDGQDHFGIGASFDLGGGAAIKGGFVDGDALPNGASFDLGLTMSF